MKSLFVCAALAAGGCAGSASRPPETHTGRLLCMEKRVDSDIVIDCLNGLNADPVEVRRRVALYNNGKDIDRRIRCEQKQTLGSSFNRWRCVRINRSGNPADVAIGVIELIDKGNTIR